MVESFLNHRSLAARIVLFALAAAGSAQAAVSFGPVSTSFNTYDNNCDYGNYFGSGGLAGSVTNGGSGLTLSGNDNIQGLGYEGPCHLDMVWMGTGSGAFPGATYLVAPTFTLTVPTDVTVSTCTLTITINGIQESQISCISVASGGTFSPGVQSFPVPTTLSTYMVDLYLVFNWNDTASTTFSINVTPGTSIDIMAPGAVPTTPVPPTLALALIGMAFLSLLGLGILRRKSALGVFPEGRV